jgi:hypothetical protein
MIGGGYPLTIGNHRCSSIIDPRLFVEFFHHSEIHQEETYIGLPKAKQICAMPSFQDGSRPSTVRTNREGRLHV